MGRNSVVIDFGRIRLTGLDRMVDMGHRPYLFPHWGRSRLVVAISWLWSFASRQNSARLITQRETKRAVVSAGSHKEVAAVDCAVENPSGHGGALGSNI